MARNPVVMETIVVLLVFALNFITDVLKSHWLHQASKAETFNFSPIPQLVQNLMVGFWTPFLFFALNKKLREYAIKEYFKTIITHKGCEDCLAMPSTSSQTLLLCTSCG